jgi:hypothetical protein
MATLRNLAAGLLRMNGFTAIKEATEWIGRDPGQRHDHIM